MIGWIVAAVAIVVDIATCAAFVVAVKQYERMLIAYGTHIKPLSDGNKADKGKHYSAYKPKGEGE